MPRRKASKLADPLSSLADHAQAKPTQMAMSSPSIPALMAAVDAAPPVAMCLAPADWFGTYNALAYEHAIPLNIATYRRHRMARIRRATVRTCTRTPIQRRSARRADKRRQRARTTHRRTRSRRRTAGGARRAIAAQDRLDDRDLALSRLCQEGLGAGR